MLNSRIDTSKVINTITSRLSDECILYIILNINRNKEEIKSIIKLAEENYKASKLLRDNNLIAFSIFHLQQATELLTKFLLIVYGIEIPKTHDQGELISKLINEIKNTPCSKLIFEPELELLLELVDEIKEISKDRINFVKSEGFIRYLKAAEFSENLFNAIMNEDTSLSYNQNEKAFQVLRFGFIVPEIVFIGIILYPHEAYTRYPERDISPDNYNKKEIPIAKDEYYDRISSIIENAIMITKEMFNKL
jgi:HEPN domain-containing protein